jgi:hypothetical protein
MTGKQRTIEEPQHVSVHDHGIEAHQILLQPGREAPRVTVLEVPRPDAVNRTRIFPLPATRGAIERHDLDLVLQPDRRSRQLPYTFRRAAAFRIERVYDMKILDCHIRVLVSRPRERARGSGSGL